VFRALVYLIFGILLIGILRFVIGAFARLFTNTTVGPQRPPAGPPRAPAPQTLIKDPVCGTFVASSTEFRKIKDGETHYFCSAACRDKY
jgi:hypothetical protein